MKQTKILLVFIAGTIVLSSATAQTKVATATNKTSAQLVASCQISAETVNFGSLILPLTTQTTTNNLSVLCNKGANYTVEMTYGGMYGQSYPGTIEYRLSGSACGATVTRYNNFNILTGLVEGTSCGIPQGAVYSSTTNKYYTGTAINFNYGKMIGSKGDNVAYSLEVPGKSGVVWNNTNKYTATGTGSVESIPLKATLVPSASGSNFPVPDMYTDTVTSKITF